MSDAQIIRKKKSGKSLKEIHEYHNLCNPSLDDMVNLVHVCRIAHEQKIPFKLEEIKRVFNNTYNEEFHGSKKSYWEYIEQFSAKV